MFSALPLVFALSISLPGPREAAVEAARLAEAAARFEEARAFSGEYLKTTRTQILSASGGLLGEEVETVRVRVKSGWQAVELVRALEGGTDVTTDRRKTWTPVPPASDPAFSAGSSTPLSSPARGLVFTPLSLPEGVCGASFAPMARAGTRPEGRLAWDCRSLTPLWAELTPADAPKELTEPRVRFDFARAGEVLYAARYTLEGLADDGGTTVKMRLVLEISDLKSAD
jgi:hypothetical protein